MEHNSTNVHISGGSVEAVPPLYFLSIILISIILSHDQDFQLLLSKLTSKYGLKLGQMMMMTPTGVQR